MVNSLAWGASAGFLMPSKPALNPGPACSLFSGRAKAEHVGFDDPPRLAENVRSEEAALSHCRRVRDEIKSFILTLPGNLLRRTA